jgi:hypothetical protein
MMKLPEQIKIGGHTVKVISPYGFKERVDLAAQCDHNMNEIRMDTLDNTHTELPESVIMVNFIHEVLHRIDFISGHKVFRDNEPAIEGISEGIYQVLADNGYLE